MTRQELASRIDHTALGTTVTAEAVGDLCAEALQHEFGGVCVPPSHVVPAVDALRDAPIRVGSVVGFPHGNTFTSVKCVEATTILEAGAVDVDMVLNVGLLKSGEDEAACTDVSLVADVIRRYRRATLRVILETALLTDEEIVRACSIAEKAGASFVKTSTGFAAAGATVRAVELMRKAVGERLRVKAAGGIRDLETAQAMITAGADRIGTSSSTSILNSMPS